MPDADRDPGGQWSDIEAHLMALHAVAEAAISAAVAVAVAAQSLATGHAECVDEAFEYRAAERNLVAALTAFRSALLDVRARHDDGLRRERLQARVEDLLLLFDGAAAMDEWQAEHGPFTVGEITAAQRAVEELRRRSAGDEPGTSPPDSWR